MSESVPTTRHVSLHVTLDLAERATVEWNPRLGETIIYFGPGVRVYLDPAGARQLAAKLNEAADQAVPKSGQS